MALSWSNDHAVTCTNTTGCSSEPFTWHTADPQHSYPIPAYVRRDMHDAGWVQIRDWMHGADRWLCPQHAAARFAATARNR
jgi:hypothetical protein